MRRIIAALLLLAALAASALARAESANMRDVSWPEYGFSLRLPARWTDAALPPEAAASGAFYAAQARDGRMALVLRARLAARGDALTPEDCAGLPGVTALEPVEMDGVRFLLARERCDDGAEGVLYRVATASLGENRLEIIFIDRTGGADDTPLAILTSFQRLRGGGEPSSLPAEYE